MAFMSDAVQDNGLSYIVTNGTRVDICYTQEPANYTEATSTYSCGNKTGITVTGPTAGDVSGRKVTVPAISDGSVTDTQTAGWQALTKPTATTDLLVARALSATQAVTTGNTFTLTTWDVEFPDPGTGKLGTSVHDSGLQFVTTNGTRIDICYTQEPANYTEATSTYTCGNKTGVTVGSPAAGDASGRKVVVPAITSGAPGSVTSSQTAGWFALSKTSATAEMLAARALSSSQSVTTGNDFTLTTWDIEIPDPV